MPDTWTPVFDLTNKNRVDKWLSDGKKQLKLVIGNIMSKRKGNFVDRKLYSRKPESIIRKCIAPIMNTSIPAENIIVVKISMAVTVMQVTVNE